MLGALGFLTMILIIVLLLKSKTVPSIAFIAVPVIAALVAGCSFIDIGAYVKEGVMDVAATACLFIFSILFFGIMTDVGVFDRLIDALVKRAGNNVIAVTITSCLVAMIGHLDGGGASTFLITIPSMLPIYKKLKMRKTSLMVICVAAMGVMNLLPWGGPTMRSASVLGIDASELWHTLIPMQAVGVVVALVVAVLVGMIEKKRGAGFDPNAVIVETDEEKSANAEKTELQRPKLFWFNVALTLAIILSLVFVDVPSYFLFMIGVAVALLVNYPGKKMQSRIIKSHSDAALMMATTLFTAGILLGVLDGSGMMDAMASQIVAILPESFGPHIALIIGILSAPLALVFSTDAYFYGVLPIIISVGEKFGVAPIEIAIAMVVCRNCASFISPVVPATFLGCGLAEIEINEHIKASFLWVFAISIICLLSGVIFGIIRI